MAQVAAPRAPRQPRMTNMGPRVEYTRIEKWDSAGEPYWVEYQGFGRLGGQTAIVTGGDSGIGRAVAHCFVREGARVSIQYPPERQAAAEELQQLAGGGDKVHLCPGNLEDEFYIKCMVEQHCNNFDGRVDVLVNGATKQFSPSAFEELDLRLAESTFRSNILATIALTQAALPFMRCGSAIINTTDLLAFRGASGVVDYLGTKGAIVSFTRALASQITSRGIRVNAIAPGPVYTDDMPYIQGGEEIMEAWGLGIMPWPPRSLQPAELAPSYVFLADSASSSGITGQVLHVNNGIYMG